MINIEAYNNFFVWSMVVGFTIIALVFITIPYRRKRAIKKAEELINKWTQKRGIYTKEMYFADLDTIGISHDTGLQIALFLNRNFLFKPDPPIYPKMDEELYEVWWLDDDIGDVVNHALTNYDIKQYIKWNDKRLAPLMTIRDLFVFIQNEIKTKKKV